MTFLEIPNKPLVVVCQETGRKFEWVAVNVENNIFGFTAPNIPTVHELMSKTWTVEEYAKP